LVGSVALVVFFHHRARVEEEVSLESLGRNNALFMDQARLPQTAQMAERLGRVMGAQVEFRDQGGGFSGKALDHFGEPFHSDREGGMGLGLAVSKEITESHGASLAVVNSSTGAAVTIRWPSPDQIK
jgi:nitrogen fixation/metabolism regulation signal transduction histidine kinase